MQGDCEEVPVEVEVHDVEEGEISDSASIEEITEDDFNSKQAPPLPVPPLNIADNLQNSNPRSIGPSQNSGAGTGSGTRVWLRRDIYKYQIASKPPYNSGLYNLAWAQAVNNKPLDEVFLMMGNGNNNDNNGGISDGSVSGGNEKNNDRIDVEDKSDKEEGELEEGEIDLDSEVVSNESSGIEFEEVKAGLNGNDVPEKKKQLDKIKEELQKLNVADAVESFSRLCSSIQNSVDGLQKMVIESSCVEKDNLAKLLLTTIKSVESVFLSMDLRLKEQNRDILSRLLVHATSLKPSLFSLLQLKEMKVVMESVDASTVSLGDYRDSKKKQVDGGHCVSFRNANHGSECLKETKIYFGCSGSGLDNPKSKGPALPLLDLHMDHDAESLPSPTRDVAPSLPFDKGFVLGHGSVKPEWPVPRQFLARDNMINHPNYETDAVEAVSTYQQKFGRRSFFRNDDLPSPTPSEEGHTEDVETNVEVTSATIRNAGNVNPSMFGEQMVGSLNSWITKQPMLSSALSESFPCLGFSNAGTTGLSNTVPRPVLKSSLSKIRDPRLRLANSTSSRNLNQCLPSVRISDHKVEHLGQTSSRKQKTVEDLMLDGPTLKRPRNDLAGNEISYAQGVTKTEGWLEDRGTIGMQVACGNHFLGNTGNLENLVKAGTGACTSSVTHHVTSKGPEKFQIVGQNSTLPVTCSVATLPVATSVSHLNNSNNPSLSRPVTLPLSSQGSQVKDPNATASLHSLLKNIAGNPSVWVDLLKSEHQKFSDSIKSLTQIPNSESILGAQQPTKGASPNLSVLGRESVGVIVTQSQTVAAEESGNNRMKPRDPRRFHYNSHQKGGSAGPDQHTTNSSINSAMTGSLSTVTHKDDLDKKSASSNSVFQPDISRQFTNNLRNIADMLSVSQASMSPSVLPEVTSSQPLKVHKGGMETKSLNFESGSLKKVTGEVTEEPVASSPGISIAWSDVEHLFEGFDDQQKAAIQRERNRRMEEQKKMFAERKLCLVLDLDHTLLNSAKFVEVDPHHDEMLRKKEEDDREKPQRHLFRFPHMGMWTKLRPGIWNFLEKCSKLFELHLYTMGNKYYATEMAKLLDPKGDLFSGRVISRGDDGDPIDSEERVPKSKDLEGVLGMESAVVIIDDSVRVWPHNKLNLIVVERYIYFPCSRRQFGLPGPSLLEIDHDERPEFGTLASSLAVIERIHQNFFAHQSLDEADVRNILASEQRKILAGCRVVFSRIFPVDEANPHMHPLWQTAEQFGAVCCIQIDDQVTHVVANSLGTNKVNWAHSTGRYVVHPGWVEASALLYRRANEHDFFIKQQTTT